MSDCATISKGAESVTPPHGVTTGGEPDIVGLVYTAVSIIFLSSFFPFEKGVNLASY